MKKDSLGDRIKTNYEIRAKTYLTRRTPVIIRLDGKAFHTYTKGLKRPYDEIFHEAMNKTTKFLCENIMGCKIGFTQSDEITLLLTDYDKPTTDAWFDYGVQKMCSVSASMATMAFNVYFKEEYEKLALNLNEKCDKEDKAYLNTLRSKLYKATFDSRCFNISEDEIVNCFIWRQVDATRNAIQMLGQANFSHKELQKKSCNDVQDMLMLQKGINFNNQPIEFKRGVCVIRNREISENTLLFANAKNGEWVIDKNIPIFSADRDYVIKCYKQ